ncbi:MAG: RNase H family protein [Bryobacteraceae bacterium]
MTLVQIYAHACYRLGAGTYYYTHIEQGSSFGRHKAIPSKSANGTLLQAAIDALEELDQPSAVRFCSKIENLILGMRDRLPRWKEHNWTKQIQNLQLWQQLDEFSQVHQIEWVLPENDLDKAELGEVGFRVRLPCSLANSEQKPLPFDRPYTQPVARAGLSDTLGTCPMCKHRFDWTILRANGYVCPECQALSRQPLKWSGSIEAVSECQF